MRQRKLIHGLLAALLVVMQLCALVEIRQVQAVESPSVQETLIDTDDLALTVDGIQNGEFVDWTVHYTRKTSSDARALKLNVKADDTVLSPVDTQDFQELKATDVTWWQEKTFSTQSTGVLRYQTPITQLSLAITAQLDEQQPVATEAVAPVDATASIDTESSSTETEATTTDEPTIVTDLLTAEIAGPHTVSLPQTQADEDAAIDAEVAAETTADAESEAVTTTDLPTATESIEATAATPEAKASEAVTKPTGEPFNASNLVLTLAAGANTGQAPADLIKINVLTLTGDPSPYGTIKNKNSGSVIYDSRDNMEKYTSSNYVAGSVSRAVFFEKPAEAKASMIEVSYPNVGQVQTADGTMHDIGAYVTVSNFVHVGHEWDNTAMAIDFASNFYSGISVANTRSFDWDVTFFLSGTSTPINFESDSTAKLTFTSLNPGEFVKSNSGLTFSTADTDAIKLTKLNSNHLAPVNYDHENGWHDRQSFKELMATGQWPGQNEAAEVEAYTSWKWGNWSKDASEIDTSIEWQDKLGAPTFGNGAAAFTLTGTTFKFTRGSYAVAGSTWLANASGDAQFIVPDLNLNKSVSSLEIEAGGSLDDIKDLADDAIYTDNNLHEQNINDLAQAQTPMYYYINQETYNVPEQVVSRPSQIIITDTLPAGMATWSANNLNADVVVYNEKPGTSILPATVVSHEEADGRQTLTITLDTDATTAIPFAGGYFSVRIKVKTTHDLDQLSETVRMENTARVQMINGDELGYDKTSNMVWTALTPPKPTTVDAEFTKVDEFGQAIKDVTFGLYDNAEAAGDAIQTQSSLADGTVRFTDLTPGDYSLAEVDTPAGYIPLADPIKISIDADGTITWPKGWNDDNEVENKFKRWTIALEKIDSNKKPLANATFSLWTKTGSKVATGTTDGQAQLDFGELKLLPGDYVLKEDQAPTGFETLKGQFEFTLERDGTLTKERYTATDLTREQYQLNGSGHKLTIVIQNNAETIPLPVTGGAGIQAFIAVAVVIMLMASMLAWHWRKEAH